MIYALGMGSWTSFFLLLLFGCADQTVYRDTWEPANSRFVEPPPRLLQHAIRAMSQEDARAAERAGVLLGYHNSGAALGLRAASTGGTHFFAVKHASDGTECSRRMFGRVRCEDKARVVRVAVVRVEPRDWDTLPAHLVPTKGELAEGVRPAAVRTGCETDDRGRVTCGNAWAIR